MTNNNRDPRYFPKQFRRARATKTSKQRAGVQSAKSRETTWATKLLVWSAIFLVVLYIAHRIV